jgi:hypothetical protein
VRRTVRDVALRVAWLRATAAARKRKAADAAESRKAVAPRRERGQSIFSVQPKPGSMLPGGGLPGGPVGVMHHAHHHAMGGMGNMGMPLPAPGVLQPSGGPPASLPSWQYCLRLEMRVGAQPGLPCTCRHHLGVLAIWAPFGYCCGARACNCRHHACGCSVQRCQPLLTGGMCFVLLPRSDGLRAAGGAAAGATDAGAGRPRRGQRGAGRGGAARAAAGGQLRAAEPVQGQHGRIQGARARMHGPFSSSRAASCKPHVHCSRGDNALSCTLLLRRQCLASCMHSSSTPQQDCERRSLLAKDQCTSCEFKEERARGLRQCCWGRQVNENTELLVKFRDNILQILNTMNSMQVPSLPTHPSAALTVHPLLWRDPPGPAPHWHRGLHAEAVAMLCCACPRA